jgi:hypothetical protein
MIKYDNFSQLHSFMPFLGLLEDNEKELIKPLPPTRRSDGLFEEEQGLNDFWNCHSPHGCQYNPWHGTGIRGWEDVAAFDPKMNVLDEDEEQEQEQNYEVHPHRVKISHFISSANKYEEEEDESIFTPSKLPRHCAGCAGNGGFVRGRLVKTADEGDFHVKPMNFNHLSKKSLVFDEDESISISRDGPPVLSWPTHVVNDESSLNQIKLKHRKEPIFGKHVEVEDRVEAGDNLTPQSRILSSIQKLIKHD